MQSERTLLAPPSCLDIMARGRAEIKANENILAPLFQLGETAHHQHAMIKMYKLALKKKNKWWRRARKKTKRDGGPNTRFMRTRST